ncbi:MAG TPA: hypothetical protein VE596_10810 [Gaiellaceae bacterium]|jgi:hypothetical protein|nr:hypothetical protein [Gaiellaceae bacterium]
MGSYTCGQFLAEPPEWLGLVLPEDEPLDFVVLVDVVVLVVPPLAALAIAAPPPASRPSTDTVATASRSLSRVILTSFRSGSSLWVRVKRGLKSRLTNA